MNKLTRLGIGAAAFGLLVTAAVVAYNALSDRVDTSSRVALPDEGEDSSPKQAAPDFAMTDWAGNTIRLSDLVGRGRPAVLNFWASWCPPCEAEMPDFDRVHADFGHEVEFVMLDMTDGARETVEIGKRFVEARGFTMPVYFDTTSEGAMTYGIRSIPTTIFIDREGYVITGVQGAIDESILRRVIDFMLDD